MSARSLLAIAAVLAAGCTGTIDDGGVIQRRGDGTDASSQAPGQQDAASAGSDVDSATTPIGDSAPPEITGDGGVVCQTSVDSYGYTRCTCADGVAALGDAAVASCTGDCCVLYGADSGLAAGFGNPTLSSDLCACFQAADIAAMLGTSATCRSFANDGVGSVVKSCH
jgi:hypothetical protein